MRRFLALSTFFALSGQVWARTEVTPVPNRDEASLSMGLAGYNLVSEERTVGLLKGSNLVSFSWRNVAVDPATLTITPLRGASGVRFIGLTYPPHEAGAVLAEFYADQDAVAVFRVSYLLLNLLREVSYQGTLTTSGESWQLRRESTVYNRSGERFQKIHVNLGDGLQYTGELDDRQARKVFMDAPQAQQVERLYRVTLHEMPMVGGAPQPLNPELFYVLTNTTAINPSKNVLSNGKVRLFQSDKNGTQAFVGEAMLQPLAFAEKAELPGGAAKDIRVKWFMDKDEERNFVKARQSAQEPDTFHVRVDRFQKVRMEVKNFKNETVDLWMNIPARFHTGLEVLKSTHPTRIEHDHTQGVTVQVKAPGGGKETQVVVEILYTDYVFNTN